MSGSIASADVTENVKVPFNAVVTNDCLGEAVSLTAPLLPAWRSRLASSSVLSWAHDAAVDGDDQNAAR